MFYPRHIGQKVRELAGLFPVILVTGARQVGKTTLVRHLYPDRSYVCLDLPSLAAKAEETPASFLAEYPPPLIIDEVQYAPRLFRHIKREVDTHRHEPGRFILTGSQAFPLMQGVTESLAGRVAVVELEPLSLAELQDQDQACSLERLIRIITRGQYPELWRLPEMPAAEYYAAYLATYLERDVRQLLNVIKLRDFERFIRVLAARSGQILNKSEVARDVGVSVKAIGDWLSVLEASNQIVLLEPYFRNITKRVVKSPKVYFTDTGLLCSLLRINAETFPDSPFTGQVFETFVFAELRKRNRLAADPWNIFFYRDQRGREVDFFLERGGRVVLLECKWAELPRREHGRHLAVLAREITESPLPLTCNRTAVACATSHDFPLGDGIEALGVAGPGITALFT